MQLTFERELSDPSALVMSPRLRVGRIVDIDARGQAFVDFCGNTQDAVAAQAIVSFPSDYHVSSLSSLRVLLAFPDGSDDSPIIVGFIRDRLVDPSHSADSNSAEQNPDADSRNSVVAGRDRVELRCGKSSIQLSREGKILIKGTQILSQATQKNRIKGGSVAIN